MKTTFSLLIFGMLTTGYTNSIAQNKYHLLVGTYTKSQQHGIFVYEFDTDKGTLTLTSHTEKISNPSFLTTNKSQNKVYSVGEENGGLVYAFDFDKNSGKLTLLNQQKTDGKNPCYITLSKDEKHLFVANYSSGNLTSFPISADGKILPLNQLIQHQGKSITSRQTAPHAHSIVNVPNSDRLLSADLGVDKIFEYIYQPNSKEVLAASAQTSVNTPAGSGPRHITFNKKGDMVYVVNELDATVSVYQYKNNELKAVLHIAMNEADFSGTNGAADIHLSGDGKFLYASNRGTANEIIIYSVDQKNGKLNKIGSQSSMGKGPRNFIIDPTDSFLLVANQNTDDIFIFRRNKKSGLLEFTGNKVNVGAPVCLVFADK